MLFFRKLSQIDSTHEFLPLVIHQTVQSPQDASQAKSSEKEEDSPVAFNENMLVFAAKNADSSESVGNVYEHGCDSSDKSTSPHTPDKPVPVPRPKEKTTVRRALFITGASGQKQIITTPEVIINLDDSDEVDSLEKKRKGKII